MATKKSKFNENIVSKMSKAEKDNTSTDSTNDNITSVAADLPQIQESVAINKDSLKETRILNENITLLHASIQTLVKGIEKSIGESARIGPSGIRGSTASKSPYDTPYESRATLARQREIERVGSATQQDVESKSYHGSFGGVLKEWKADKEESVIQKLRTAVRPKEWDIRPIMGVEQGSGGIVDRLLSNREARQARDKDKQEYVQGAVKFGGVDKDTAKEQYEKIFAAQQKTAEINKRINEAKEAGYAPSKSDEAAREKALREQIALDPRKSMYDKLSKQLGPQPTPVPLPPDDGVKPTPVPLPPDDGVKPTPVPLPPDDVKPTPVPLPPGGVKPTPVPLPPKPTLSGTELSETESESAVVNASIGETLKASLETQRELLSVFKEYFKEGKGGGKDGEGKGSGGEEGGGDSLLDSAGDLLDGKGKGKAGKVGKLMKGAKKALPILKSASSFIGRNAGKIGAAAGVAAGAYEAYTGWGDANEQLESGKITKDEADEKKGEAVGGGAGGAAGAWAGAAAGAAIGSVIPLAGTAVGGLVGGALGYMAGSGLGKKVGGSLVSGYKSLFGGSKEEPAPVPEKPPVNTLDRSDVLSTSENAPPSMDNLGGGGVALAGGNDSQLQSKIPNLEVWANKPPKLPELEVWANKPPKLKEPVDATSQSPSLFTRGLTAVGSVGLASGQALHDNVSSLRSWAMDDKKSLLEKVGDVATFPARSIGKVGLAAGQAMQDSVSSLGKWAMDDKKSLLEKAGDVAMYPARAITRGMVNAGGVVKDSMDWLIGGDTKPATNVQQTGRQLADVTKEVNAAKDNKLSRDVSTSVVNAPTTINNNTTNVGPPLPIRNPEMSQSRYINTRFAF